MKKKQKKWIYFAGPLFTRAEIEFNKKLSDKIIDESYEVFLPQKECQGLDVSDIYNKCIEGLDNAFMVIAILDGVDADSGTSFEVGYAKAKEIPILGIRTDFRQSCDDGGLNLMLSKGCDSVIVFCEEDYDTYLMAELNKFVKLIL